MATHFLSSDVDFHLLGETWKPVLGWEGYYEASSVGRVRSLSRYVRMFNDPLRTRQKLFPGRILCQQLNTGGYPQVHLCRTGERVCARVHILICQAFYGPRPEGMIVAHNDGNTRNCRADNLRYATLNENMEDQLRHGTLIRGERCGAAKLTEKQVSEIRSQPYTSRGELAKAYGVSVSMISDIRSRRAWKHI